MWYKKGCVILNTIMFQSETFISSFVSDLNLTLVKQKENADIHT